MWWIWIWRDEFGFAAGEFDIAVVYEFATVILKLSQWIWSCDSGFDFAKWIWICSSKFELAVVNLNLPW